MSEDDILECRCCEKRVQVKFMMKVPSNKKIMTNWVNMLGERFKNNLKNDANYVCLKHFESPSESVKKRGRKVKIDKVKVNQKRVYKPKPVKKRYPTTCRYCLKKCDQKQMSSVPQRADILAKWIDILGPEFKKNLKGYQRSFICMVHFNIPAGTRRKIHDLPVKMQIDTPIDNTDKFQMPVLKKEPDFEYEEAEDIPNLGHFDVEQEVEVEGEEEDEEEIQRIRNAHYVRRTCTYCDTSKNEKDMTRVPRKQELFAEWAKILGATFCENVKNRSNFRSFICLTHFDLPNNRKFRKATDLPIRRATDVPVLVPMKKVKKEVDVPLRRVKKEVEELPIRKIKQEPAYAFRKVKQEPGYPLKKVKKEPGPREYVRERVCTFCDEKKEQTLMTRVTENEQILAKWIAILGKKFANNLKNRASRYVCLSHFDLPAGVTSRRKHDLPRVLKKVKTEPKDVEEPKQSKAPRANKTALAVRTQSLRNQLVKLDPIHLSNMEFFGFFYDKKTYKILRIKTEEPLDYY